jgi:metal-responsive CopG/Arc/MetJ family transcriptional regulator
MKKRISLTLSVEVLSGIDRLRASMSRSEFIEEVLRQYLRDQEAAERKMRDAGRTAG